MISADLNDPLLLAQTPPLEAKRRLVEREAFYRSILNSLGEGLIITDRESRILYANSKMEEISGLSRDQMLGMISYELFSPREEWPRMQQRLRERLAGASEVYEHEHLRADGRRHWIAVRAVPYCNSDGEIIGTLGMLSCIEERKSLELENEYLRSELRADRCTILGQSPALRAVLEQIAMVAPTPASVLITGESGTGKELVAQAIHEGSTRQGKPLVRVNCAAIPKELFESEFFGHVKGAFTGALKDRVGRFELANGGTLFLDEVGEIPLELQSKLLRVLQERQFEKVGDERTRTVDVRVIAATNSDLLAAAKAGRFRLDLYYRLSVFPIDLPPLRERPEDIEPLARHFLQQSARRLGVRPPSLNAAQACELAAYDWPGNVRELQNVIERAVILARRGGLRFELGSPAAERSRPAASSLPEPAAGPVSLSELKTHERALLLDALRQTDWKVYGPGGAAERLGLPATTLASKMKKLRLTRPR